MPDTSASTRRWRRSIREWGRELGFQQIGIAGVDIARGRRAPDALAGAGSARRDGLHAAPWPPARAAAGTGSGNAARHLGAHGLPAAASARRRTKCWPMPSSATCRATRSAATITKCCAAGCAQLAEKIRAHSASRSHRVFVDSGPILEKAFARDAGLGWIGKHTNLLNRQRRLVVLSRRNPHRPAAARRCSRRPITAARAAPASTSVRRGASSRRTSSMRRAAFPISRSSCATRFPMEFRKAMGNRIYGCDDCQLVCPWNKFARFAAERDFTPRHGLDDAASWSSCSRGREAEFLARTEGSAIRRIGYECWLRNIAVALGNAPTTRRGRASARVAAGRSVSAGARARAVGAGAARCRLAELQRRQRSGQA